MHPGVCRGMVSFKNHVSLSPITGDLTLSQSTIRRRVISARKNHFQARMSCQYVHACYRAAANMAVSSKDAVVQVGHVPFRGPEM